MTTLLKTEAYQGLVQMINEGRIKYGEIYSLNKIAAALDMSRTPVRDAVQRLCDEKRLEMLPSRGFRLYRLSEDEVLEAYHFSIAIEGYCALRLSEAAARGEKGEWLARLQETIAAMKAEALEELDFAAFYALDNGFHQLLIASLEDAPFAALSENRYGFYNRTELHLTEPPVSRQLILAQHEAILAAIRVGDGEGAYRALLCHADLIYDNYLQHK